MDDDVAAEVPLEGVMATIDGVQVCARCCKADVPFGISGRCWGCEVEKDGEVAEEMRQADARRRSERGG